MERATITEEASKAQLTPGPYGKIAVKSTYSSYISVLVGGRKCFLDPLTEIRINGTPLDLNEGSTTESAMEKLSKIFNRDKLKEISCISYTTIPVGTPWEYIKEINLDVPEHLRVGAFGMFKLCVSYPEIYYILKEEPSARVHLNTGKLYFRNEETMEFKPFIGIRDMTPLEDLNKWLIDNPSRSLKKLEETTMKHKCDSLGIKNIIFNGPATIIFWDDDTKTVVKCGEGDVFDPEKGIAMAVMKRALGTNETDSNYLNKVKKYIDEYYNKYGSDIETTDFLTSVTNMCDDIRVSLGATFDDVKSSRLKAEAMDIRAKMEVSGASKWELETFDRFCKKYITPTSDEKANLKKG